MARRRMDYVNRGNKKHSALLPSLAVVIVSFLVAFVGAYAWQGISGDDTKYLEKQQMLRAAQSTQQASAASSSAQESASSTPEGQAASQQSGGASSTAQSAAPAAAGDAEAEVKPALVPESERVKSEYFDDAVFVGDSITDGIRSYELMQNTSVIAFTGINPDSIRTKAVYRDANGNLLTILQGMAQHQDAKKIYVMLGANSASWMDHDLFIQYYEEFLQSVQKQHPEAVIYLQSITPLNEPKFKQHYTSQQLTNAKIDALNADLLKVAEKMGIYYLDVASALKGADGALPDEATSDGMHFSTIYYQKWFDYLKTHTVQQSQQ